MSVLPPQLMVAIAGSMVILKISGWANAALSVHFKKVLFQLKDKGYTQFSLELSECTLMDSTFLGVLAGFCIKITHPGSNVSNCKLILQNANGRVLDLLDNMGIRHLFEIGTDSTEDANFTPATGVKPAQIDLAQTSIEAHQTLMSLNPDNITKFKDVIAFLEEDLKGLSGK